MEYAKAVAEAKKILTRSEADQWELARLTYEATTGPKAGTLTQWAEDLGFSQPHATNLRKTWVMFRSHKRTYDAKGQSFNECYNIASASPERAAELKKEARRTGRKVSTVRRDRGGRRTPPVHGDRERHPADRLRDLRDALLDREGRRELLDDPVVRRAVENELARAKQRERDELGEDVVRFIEELTAMRYRLLQILRDMLDYGLTEDERRELLPIVVEIQASIVWAKSHLKNGTTSFEDALDALLAEAPPTKPITRPKRRPPRPSEKKGAKVVELPTPEPDEDEPAADSPPAEAPGGAPRRRLPAKRANPTRRGPRRRQTG